MVASPVSVPTRAAGGKWKGEKTKIMNNNNIIQLRQQYLANWHDSFVNGVTQMQNLIANILIMPNVTAEDKQGLEFCRLILDGKDVQYIEKNCVKE